VHFNVTENPTAEWTAQQIVEAFPWDTAPRYLLRDRDGVYGQTFRGRVESAPVWWTPKGGYCPQEVHQ
jgi:putative transposase